jgi:hypothetical protein
VERLKKHEDELRFFRRAAFRSRTDPALVGRMVSKLRLLLGLQQFSIARAGWLAGSDGAAASAARQEPTGAGALPR